MSTAAVSSIPISQQLHQYFQTRRTDLQELGKALEHGNLAGAQAAYNKIVQLGQNGPKAGYLPSRGRAIRGPAGADHRVFEHPDRFVCDTGRQCAGPHQRE